VVKNKTAKNAKIYATDAKKNPAHLENLMEIVVQTKKRKKCKAWHLKNISYFTIKRKRYRFF